MTMRKLSPFSYLQRKKLELRIRRKKYPHMAYLHTDPRGQWYLKTGTMLWHKKGFLKLKIQAAQKGREVFIAYWHNVKS